MDRTSWIGVIVCIALFFGWNLYVETKWPRPVPKPKPAVAATQTASTTVSATAQPAATSDVPSLTSGTASTQLRTAKVPANAGPEQTVALENELMTATFSSFGGDVQLIGLKKHSDEGDLSIVLNRASPEGIFNLTGWDGDYTQVPYAMEKQGDAVIFQRTLPSGAVLKRTYKLAEDYQVLLTQEISNPTAKPVVLPEYRLNVGTAGPIHVHDNQALIMAGYCVQQGTAFHKITVPQFAASSFLGYKFHEARDTIPSEGGPLQWASVMNQFYALILAPQDKLMLQGADAHPVKLPQWGPKSTVVPEGVRVEARVAGVTVDAGQTVSQQFSLYAGPKEYARLKKFDRHQDLVMDFGMFGWIIKPLLLLMRGVHNVIPSWGWTIIVMTIIIKGALWPLQSVANKSMKQMQALQPKVEQLREKYKEDPQKLNAEMLSLYRDYGVNPAGGCLPLLVQMPIFIGFYFMLQGAVELRGSSFLWIHDLVQPDTIAKIPGFGLDINPLPLLMTATQILLARMTPQSSDNPQMKMMQWMPLVLLFVLYNFAAALALYWTVSNLISMVQTYINLRRPVPALKRVPKKK